MHGIAWIPQHILPDGRTVRRGSCPRFSVEIQRLVHGSVNLLDGSVVGRADSVGAAVLTAKEDRPEPDGEVSRVEIRAARRAVPTDADRAAAQGVADEVPNGKVGVERQIRARGPRVEN